MKKRTTTERLELVALAEVPDMRHVSWNADWLRAAAYAWRLKPGQGVLFVNRKHDKLRAVAMLDEPVLVCFGTQRKAQQAVFTATVAALVASTMVRLSLKDRRTLATRDWTKARQLGSVAESKRKAA